jgi:P22 coat protein - gene protein 5
VGNLFLNTNWISMDVLRNLTNSLTVSEYFNTEWEGDFNKEFAVGAQVQVKFPQQFLIRDGLGYNPQGIDRISTTVNLDQPFGIDFQWDDYENAVKAERSEEEIREQYLMPAGVQLAQEVDSRAANWATIYTSNIVGALGTDPTSLVTYDLARSRLLQKAAPPGKRCMLVSSSQMVSIGGAITTLLQPVDEITEMFKEGVIGRAKNFDWFEEQSLYSVTAGTWANAVTVSGAGQSGTALIVTDTAGDTFNAGDKFSIANVNAVNPRTRRTAGPLTAQQFTVTVAVTGTGTDTLTILPAMYGPGSQYQNVDNLPVNGAALTLWPGTTSPNGKTGTFGLALTKYAFALSGAKLYSPKAVEVCSQKRDPRTGLAVRFVKAWDPVRSMEIHRFDMVIGFGNLYTDNGAVGVLGQ